MADNIQIKRVDGGVLCPSATWSGRTRVKDNYTQITTLTGSGPAFELNKELLKLQGVMTQYGVYQNHTINDGSPGIYDRITITFQALLNPPQYVYDFNAPTKSYSLGTHPSYRTYWDNDLVWKGTGSAPSMSASELGNWQLISDGSEPSSFTDGWAWLKNNQAKAPSVTVGKTTASSTDLTSGHSTLAAKKPGINSYIYPAVSIRETIYFAEERDFTFNIGPAQFTEKRINTKNVSALAGKAGWPLRTTFGYPKDVYTLLNDSSYSDYKQVGVDKNGTVVNLSSAFYQQRGIPITQYITSSANGEYRGASFGHPLWICTNCAIKKVGYWFEATLQWEYYGMGVDADLYPLATSRVAGLA